MSLQSFPDWSKVGRRIGKRLRGILDPPKNTGPTPEERKAQRQRDLLKGFAYFDTWDEVFEWDPAGVDQTQKANVSLCHRSIVGVHGTQGLKTRLVLCHDYSGGYHDYESNRASPVENKMYSCQNLQCVDTFIYFSHKLVCIPPASWANLLHRNGVKVLGTFILEPQSPNPERLFEDEGGTSLSARILAKMAETYAFDGWLINIEREFPGPSPQIVAKLQLFLRDLKRCLGHDKVVIWYDAVNVENEVEYQNGLTQLNASFAKSADALFTNYKWDKEQLRSSTECAALHDIRRNDVLFGVDVWAQNTNMPGPPRITFPPKGGGGTNTGFAMKTLANNHFSTAVFGPAWSFEHFSTVVGSASSKKEPALSTAEAVDEAMWFGEQLPQDLHCNCEQGTPHHTALYGANPITASAQGYPAGSCNFFFTDFTQAFLQDGDSYRSILGSQAILPCPQTKSDNMCWTFVPEGIAVIASATKAKTGTADIIKSPLNIWDRSRLRLYNLNIPVQDSLCFEARCEKQVALPDGDVSLYLAYTTSSSADLLYRYFTIPADGAYQRCYTASPDVEVTAIVEVGISRPAGAYLEPGRILAKIHNIGIHTGCSDMNGFHITNIRTAKRQIGREAERRLTWSWSGSGGARSRPVPWSQITGPFSHFDIYVNHKKIGRAHSCEFPLREGDLPKEEEYTVAIKGRSFAGGHVVAQIDHDGILSEDDEWVLVES